MIVPKNNFKWQQLKIKNKNRKKREEGRFKLIFFIKKHNRRNLCPNFFIGLYKYNVLLIIRS